MSLRLQVAPVRHVLFDTGEIEGFGWSCFTAAEGDGARGRRRAHGRRHDAGERAPARSRSTRPTARTRSTTADGLRGRGLRTARRRRRRRRHVQLLPARRRPRRSTGPTRFVSHVAEAGPVRGARRRRGRLHLARVRGRRRARCARRRSDETVARDGAHHARAARRANGSCGSRTRSTTTPAITACARTSRCPRRSTAPTRSARSRSCTAASPPRAACTSSACRRSRRAGSSTRPTAPRASRLLHDGLLEYEVVDDGRALALTLLRAVGYLSRTDPQLRPNPAGPPDPLEGPQLQGTQRAEYAVLLHAGDWRAADCYGAADAFLVPFERTRVRDAHRREPAGCGRGAPRRRRRGVGGAPRARRARRARLPHRRRRRHR